MKQFLVTVMLLATVGIVLIAVMHFSSSLVLPPAPTDIVTAPTPTPASEETRSINEIGSATGTVTAFKTDADDAIDGLVLDSTLELDFPAEYGVTVAAIVGIGDVVDVTSRTTGSVQAITITDTGTSESVTIHAAQTR